MAESRKLTAERETWRQLHGLADEIDRRLDALPESEVALFWSGRLGLAVRGLRRAAAQMRGEAQRAARGRGDG